MDRYVGEIHQSIENDQSRFQMNSATLAQEISKVYYWMFFGLLLTGSAAYAVSTSESLFNFIFSGGLYWIFMLAPLAMVFILISRIHKMSASTAATMFLVYSLLTGVSLASIFIVYSLGSIFQTFIATSVTFFIMASYGYTTKKDLTGFGKLALFALVGIIISSLLNVFFFQSTGFDLLISGIGVLLFTGLIAYDTQKIKEYIIYSHGTEGSVSGKAVIMGALSLYLDFLNLFLFLLRFLGNRD